LAENHGGSLTINPETGLPEAGFLDKLLPTIIGAGISFFSQGTIDPMTAAAMVGGVETARTGDIGKGISAGLGAYGGASLTAGMTGAGADAISTPAAGDAYASLGANAITDAQALAQGFGSAEELMQTRAALAGQEAVTAAGPFESLSRGFDIAKKAGPMQYLKANAMPLAAAFGPAILAGESAEGNMPKTTTGMISPYTFDPYSGTYTAANPYQATPTRAAGGGLMGMDDGGYGPGQLDFTQQSEPVVRMAEGGIAGYAGNEGSLVGGDAALTAYQQGRYGDASRLLADAGMSAQDVVSKYGLSQADAAAVAKNLGYAGDMSGIQYAAAPPVVQAAAAPVAQANTPMSNTVAAAPAYTQYTPEQMGSYLTTNPNVDLATAIKTTNADPAAVNRYIASLTKPFIGSTDTTGGSGTLGIYNQLTTQGVDPTEYYNAAIANDPKYAGWTKEMIQRGYDLDKGAYALSAQIEKDKIAADPVLGHDKSWAKFMDDNKYTVDEMAQAFGISKNEVTRRYNAAKATQVVTCGPGFKLSADGKSCVPDKKGPITCGAGYKLSTDGLSCVRDTTVVTEDTSCPSGSHYDSKLKMCVLNTSATQDTSTNVTTPTDISTAVSTSLPVGISGAGITTINPNGTVTTRPDLSLGMKEVRDAYEAGGGSLGVNKNLFAPKTYKEIEDRYKLTGGSKQSYDYLTGKTPYSPKPVTETGEIMKPYAESVLGIPANMSKKMYIFKNGKYEVNPDYAIPTYDKDGKKSSNLTNADVKTFMNTKPSTDVFYTWATTNNLSPEQIATASERPINEISKLFTGAKDLVGEDGKIDQTKLDEKTTADEKTNFDADAYLKANPDVQAELDAGKANFGTKDDPAAAAYEHYLRYGKAGGRKYTKKAKEGGLMAMAMARGGMAQQFNLGDYSDGGRLLRGPGDGVSDSIPASIGGKRPARLADGEFVVPARIVSELGNGSTEAGARKLYAMMDRIQSARGSTVGKGRVAKNSRAEKHLPA
jgi:AraC-like DNA-binding protein